MKIKKKHVLEFEYLVYVQNKAQLKYDPIETISVFLSGLKVGLDISNVMHILYFKYLHLFGLLHFRAEFRQPKIPCMLIIR